jgi:hypothetical protein
MKTLLSLVSLFAVIHSAVGSAGKTREEAVFLFENRKVTLDVPEPITLSSTKDDSGVVLVRLANPSDTLSMDIRFLPDPDGQFASARTRKEFINQMFNDYVGTSSEKAMQFEELDPRVGAGTYCVFTDANLVGKTKLPPGEYLHLTSGLKAWPGVVAVFRFFSNDTTSSDYQTVMKMLRESVHEKPVPLR